jgi:hypothetical protein
MITLTDELCPQVTCQTFRSLIINFHDFHIFFSTTKFVSFFVPNRFIFADFRIDRGVAT